MKTKRHRPRQGAGLRQRAEKIAQGKTARVPESLAVMSSHEVRKALHGLRVHQIELAMQNEELRRAQVELDAARARYFDLYDLAPVGYITLSDNGLILEANFTAATLLGVGRDALVKQPVSRFIFKEDQDLHYHRRKQLIKTGEPQSYDLRMLRQDGTRFWANLNAVVEQGGNGAPVRRVVISDITERKQAEVPLKENEQRLRLFIDHAPAALAMLDRKMCYVTASRRWMSDFGLGERDLHGLSHYEVFPEIPERWTEVHRRALAGEVLRADMDRFERADGSVQWIRWEVRPWHDPAGNIGGIVIFSEDLSDIKRGEESLRTSEERLAAIIGSATDVIITVDEKQRVVLFNTAAEKIFRCTASEAIGKSLQRFLPERFRTAHRGHIQRFGATGVTSRSMHSFSAICGQRSDGEEFPCEATISQASAGGQKLYTVILRDTSERKVSEQLRQLSAHLLDARDQERRQVAVELHENVAQHFAALGIYLSLAGDAGGASNVEVKRFLDQGHTLLKQISTEIRTMAGVLYPAVLDRFGLAAAIQWYVRGLKEGHGIEVSMDIASDLGRLPAEHELALFRVMEEGLTNVRRHSGVKTATVRVFRDAFEVALEVVDAGCGTSLSEGQATGHGPKGTGIVEMGERMRNLGGRLKIASGRKGTTVRAALPFVPLQSKVSGSGRTDQEAA